MEVQAHREPAKCLKCGYEWDAIDFGQGKPSRCGHCKSRNVKWKRNCTEKQKNAHMPEDLKDEMEKPISEPEFKTEPDIEVKSEPTIEEKPEVEQVVKIPDKPEKEAVKIPTQPTAEKQITVKSMPQKKEHPEKKVRKSPAKRPAEEMEKIENSEEYFNAFDDFLYDKNDEGWKQAKASTPKINPAGIIILLGAAAAVAGVVFFLRKNPGFFAGKIHQAPNRKAVQASGNTAQAQARPRPATLDAPRLGGML